MDEKGSVVLGYVELPNGYDIDDITTYKTIVEKVNEMKLTDRQKLILKYRLQGVSNHQIANKLGIARATLIEHLKAIQKKATAIDLTPHN